MHGGGLVVGVAALHLTPARAPVTLGVTRRPNALAPLVRMGLLQGLRRVAEADVIAGCVLVVVVGMPDDRGPGFLARVSVRGFLLQVFREGSLLKRVKLLKVLQEFFFRENPKIRKTFNQVHSACVKFGKKNVNETLKRTQKAKDLGKFDHETESKSTLFKE